MQISIFIFIVFSLFSHVNNESVFIEYILHANSSISINGTSSMHNWNCDCKNLEGVVKIDSKTHAFNPGSISIPIKDIDCYNSVMTTKLQQAMNMKSNPSISYQLKDVVQLKELQTGEHTIHAKGILTISGVSKTIETDVECVDGENDVYTFEGREKIHMSDYSITPPTAMGGLLKTGDQVVIKFKLVFVRKSN